MTALHEAEVNARFDLLHARFKREVPAEDFRLRAILDFLGLGAGERVLDLGCGKGRFARRLAAAGFDVVGLDLSASMLGGAAGIDRVRASARRLPFASGTFDAAIAVETFEHLAGLDDVLGEVARVLRPGGKLAVVDKNVLSWNATRPWLPSLVVKRIDERRGRWMYPSDGPVRERWFRPGGLKRQISRRFDSARVTHLISDQERASALFRCLPSARLMALWTAHAPGGDRR